MSNKNDGIQMLLQAEKRASEKVNEARRRKARRLKQAKQEAQLEIEAERAERERQYKDHEARVLGSKTDVEQQVNLATQRKMGEQAAAVATHKDEAIARLIQLVLDIRPVVHVNFKQ